MKFLCSVLLTVSLSINLAIADVTSEGKLANVSYNSVTQLAYDQAEAKFSYGEDESQYVLYWSAKNPIDDPAPIIIFIHGGCWLKDYDIAHSLPLASALSKQGYGVWSIEYRRTGQAGGGWPGSFEDIKEAITLLFNKQIGDVDYSNVVIVGHSAGGHLAMLAAKSFEENIQQAIGLAAITDLPAYAKGNNSCEQVAPKFMGGTHEVLPAQYKKADPRSVGLHHNTVLMHGSLDSIVALEQSVAPSSSQILVDKAGHFDWIHPHSAAYAKLLKHLQATLH